MTKNIHQRLHAVMQKCDYIQREAKAGMRYKIVSHDKVTAYVRPVLVENGIVYYPVALTRQQNGNRTEIDLTVRFANIDEPGDFIDVVATGYGVDDQDKGPGKAISYAVKYCLLKALGLETGDDPDETQDDKANHRPPVLHNAPPPQQQANAKPPRDEAFFKRQSYEIIPPGRALADWDRWQKWFRAAASDCKIYAEWVRLEDDNLTHRNNYADKVSANEANDLLAFVREIDSRLNPALKP